MSRQDYTITKNGKDVTEPKLSVLTYVYRGQKSFVHWFMGSDKYESKSPVEYTPLTPGYDFLLLAGSMGVSSGEFYEVTYFDSPQLGTVRRGLVQCRKPETDIQLLLGTLIRKGLLPKTLTPDTVTWTDIDLVLEASCNKQDIFYAPHRANDPEHQLHLKEPLPSTLAEVQLNHTTGCCYEYRCGERLVEVWVEPTDTEFCPPVLVHGGENVNDPAFNDRRASDLEEMQYHIEQFQDIADRWGLKYTLLWQDGEPPHNGIPHYSMSITDNAQQVITMLDRIMAQCQKDAEGIVNE